MKYALSAHQILALLALTLMLVQQYHWPLKNQHLAPEKIYRVSLNTSFTPTDQATHIRTYIPDNDRWQTVLSENLSITRVNSSEQFLPSGRLLTWQPEDDETSAGYQIDVHVRGVHYQLDPLLTIPERYDSDLNHYLKASEHIQVDHPELKTLWQSLSPSEATPPPSGEARLAEVLQAIYNYTYEQLEGAPFKGTTDALTAARLGVASCNGKSRLFVALARMNNIPARLVGGIILDDSRKKTSHQWVEAYAEGRWLTFDPTNGYFAERPAHYLKLYEGDHALFRHTAHIGFDYLFTLSSELKSPALHPELLNGDNPPLWLANALVQLNLSDTTLAIILLFPLCALIITFLRNVIGIKTFGIFMPVLIASTFLHTGLLLGFSGLSAILLLAWLCHHWLEKQRVLKTARLAIVVSVVSMVFILVLWQSAAQHQLTLGMLALMPVVIISFMAERIHQVADAEHLGELLKTTGGSVLAITLCYFYLNSHLLLSAFILLPQIYLLVVAGLMLLGRWEGLRSSELFRFKRLPTAERFQLLGINARNRSLVYQHNDKSLLTLAADKLASKEKLQAMSIPVPKTLAVFRHNSDLQQLPEILSKHSHFVIKPNQGSQGNGIIVIREAHQPDFISASGKHYHQTQLATHIRDILTGHFSQNGGHDQAYLEPVIQQHPQLDQLYDKGLADVRIIVVKGQCTSAMLRLPTSRSNGKANLHQGAIGIAIDLQTGCTQRAIYQGRNITHHPDTQQPLLGIHLPHWQTILTLSGQCYQAIPLGYLGVDICLDASQGPLVLEVNGRAGLEIQNIHQQGLAGRIQTALGDA